MRQAIYELKKSVFDVWHFFDDLHTEHDNAVKRSVKGLHLVIESERKKEFRALYRKIFVASGLYGHLLPTVHRRALDGLSEVLSEEGWFAPAAEVASRLKVLLPTGRTLLGRQ
ncbi:hypothetical protein [Micromonospora lupini]|uniref:hypothetical protein n=1 Tax=Micromonospora lupini TaxID=285679 RepID=UPI00340DCFB0